MAELLVVSGLAGAGKSTYTRKLVDEFGAVPVARDEIRLAFRNKVDEGTVGIVVAQTVRRLLEHGYSVIADAWNLHAGDYADWHDMAAELGATLRWFHVSTPLEECIRRDATRPQPNGERAIRHAAEVYAERIEYLEARYGHA